MENSNILNKVLDKFKDREQTGLVKYGTTMDRGDLSIYEWLTHLQEELMDATLYVEKLKWNLQEEVEQAAIDMYCGDNVIYEKGDEISWGPDTDLHEEERERRMNIIGQNGNDGLHYGEFNTYPGDVKITIDEK